MSTKSSNSWDDAKRRAERNHSKAVSADVEEMKTYKRFFHPKGHAIFQIVPEREGSAAHPKIVRGTFSEAKKELLAASAEGAMILMNVHETDGEGRKATNIGRIKAVYIDQDDGLDLQKMKRLKLPPDLIVRTSKRGGHSFWLVKNCDHEMFRSTQIALATRFGADPSRTSPAHPNRMAGSVHYKDSPSLVEIAHMNKRPKPIRVKKLIQKLGLKVEKVKDKHAEPRAAPSRETTEAEIRSALSFVPVAEDRKAWLRILMAIHSALSGEAGYALGVEWSKQSPKFNEKDQRRTWDSLRSGRKVTAATLFAAAAKHGWTNPVRNLFLSGLPSTQFELVDAFAAAMKDRLRYNEELKKWLVFEQPGWVVSESKAVQCARREVERLIHLAKDSDDKAAKALLKKYASVPGVRSLLSHATSHPDLVVRHHVFDYQPNLLAVQNCVIDLTTGASRDGRPDDFLIRRANAIYDPKATASKFRAFIDFLACGDKDLAQYIQTLCGYIASGDPVEQKLVYASGDGGNGKGVLMRRMENTLGTYVTTVAPNLLTGAYSGNPQGPSPAFMAMHGARMYLCGEVQEGKKFDTTFLKQLSGNDTFTARAGYADQTEFRPVGTLWISANSLPEVDRHDKAMWRRLLILPC